MYITLSPMTIHLQPSIETQILTLHNDEVASYIHRHAGYNCAVTPLEIPWNPRIRLKYRVSRSRYCIDR